MIASRELYLSVIDNGGIGKQSYEINEDITVLMNNDCVIRGIIEQIDEKYLIIFDKNKEYLILKYKDIKKIANTDWLSGEDIRDS